MADPIGGYPAAGARVMTAVWGLAALWLGLALIASLLSIWFRISTALSEIVVGTIAQLIIGAAVGSALLGTDESWVKFLSGLGATRDFSKLTMEPRKPVRYKPSSRSRGPKT